MSLTEKILKHINQHSPGWVFTPADFLNIGTPHAIGMVLLRLTQKKKIRRLAHGLYNLPKEHEIIGPLTPTPDEIANALAKRDCFQFQPSGAYAANLLGLSDQVPARVTYLCNTTSRIIKIGKQTIQFSKSSMRRMATAGRISGLVFEALRYLGKQHVNQETVAPLRKLLSEQDRHQILKDLNLAPVWMHEIISFIAEVKIL